MIWSVTIWNIGDTWQFHYQTAITNITISLTSIFIYCENCKLAVDLAKILPVLAPIDMWHTFSIIDWNRVFTNLHCNKFFEYLQICSWVVPCTKHLKYLCYETCMTLKGFSLQICVIPFDCLAIYYFVQWCFH